MKLKHWTSTMTILGLSMALCCSTARAAEFNLDFETDPEDFVDFYGTSEWREDDGVDDSGYLKITDAVGSERGAIVFPDLENGQSLTAFRIEADLRVGGGTDSPADGFSFNFARPGDPVLDDGEDWASSPTGEANLPEEGTTTGLAIGFDEWFSGGADVIGMSVRIDNNIVAEIPFPVLNGDVNDTESLQTMAVGDEDPLPVFDDELQDRMAFARLELELCNNVLSIGYKGEQVYNETVEYDPSPGLLVFGGRTGGSNAYHHIDNISIKTGEDVGVGCSVVPPSFVAGEDTIGTRAYDATETNRELGPPQDGVSGFSVKLVDTDLTVDNLTIAEGILEDEDGEVTTGSYNVVDLAGGGGTFGVNLPYPNGVADESMEDFAVQAVADVKIPAGTYTIGVGSDDGAQITIEGITFDNFSDPNDSLDEDQIRFEAPRGHGWTVGSFTVAEDLETTIFAAMFERGGGDTFEIAITEDEVIEAANPDDWELLGNGVLGWEVTHTGIPLVSADLEAGPVTSERPIEFDVNGDTGDADALTIENPDPNIFTTILELGDDLTFQIKATGTLTDGERFKIVDVDQITGGTPTITAFQPPGQVWGYDAATGEICVNACGDVPSGGDYNMDGVLDAVDIDMQAAEMKKDVADQDLAKFDHNGDNKVDVADRTIWVKDLKDTWVGDSNFDREFNSGDLVAVFAAGKYETGEMAGWAQGDWDGDMVFGSGDLVAAFSDGGYEQGEPAAVAAVPEPSSLVLALLSVMGLIGVVRRRNG